MSDCLRSARRLGTTVCICVLEFGKDSRRLGYPQGTIGKCNSNRKQVGKLTAAYHRKNWVPCIKIRHFFIIL